MFYCAHHANLEFLFHNQVVLDQKAHQVPRVYQDRLGPRVLPAQLEKEGKREQREQRGDQDLQEKKAAGDYQAPLGYQPKRRQIVVEEASYK